MHFWVIELGHHSSRKWTVVCSTPSHQSLNQSELVSEKQTSLKFRYKYDIFISTGHILKFHLKMSAILFAPQCVYFRFCYSAGRRWYAFVAFATKWCRAQTRDQGASIRIPMLKITSFRDRLIFNMGIPYLGKTVFILRRDPEEQPRRISW